VQSGANATGTYVYDAFGRQTEIPGVDTQGGTTAGDLQVGYYDNDLVRSLSQNGTSTTFALDPLLRRSTSTSVTGGVTTTVSRHYADATDNPAWVTKQVGTAAAETTWYGSSLGGDLGVTVKTGGANPGTAIQLADLHGDIAIPITVDATSVLSIGGYSDFDEFGRPLTGTAAPDTGGVSYGWLGDKERATDEATGLMLMGVRLYNAVTGLFTSVDPVPGGNTTAYAYPQDPINKYDLDGRSWGWFKKAFSNVAKTVAKVASVASFIPGPIGQVAAGIETAAHLATGNYKRAAAAAVGMIPGGKYLATAAKFLSKAGKTARTTKAAVKLNRKDVKAIAVHSKASGHYKNKSVRQVKRIVRKTVKHAEHHGVRQRDGANIWYRQGSIVVFNGSKAKNVGTVFQPRGGLKYYGKQFD
jgi:RHS repeat-associated protein